MFRKMRHYRSHRLRIFITDLESWSLYIKLYCPSFYSLYRLDRAQLFLAAINQPLANYYHRSVKLLPHIVTMFDFSMSVEQ